MSRLSRLARFPLAFTSIAAVCVAALAGASAGSTSAGAEPPPEVTAPADLSGRWEGRANGTAFSRACDGEDCTKLIRLDISACGTGWCGVEVAGNGTCGGTALRLEAAVREEEASFTQFTGKLELANGTEPYVIEAIFIAPDKDRGPRLQLTGDTGGEFRYFRRSFPLSTALDRTGEASCKPEKTVSFLMR